MGCEKLKVDRVICDEIFFINDTELEVPIGEIVIPEGSTIAGDITVAVLDCKPVIDIDNDTISASVTLMVQKELTITLPDETEIPLEFAFRLQENLIYRKCTPNQLIEIDDEFLNNLRCHIVSISGNDIVTLTPSTDENFDATFDEILTVQLKVKIVQEQQLFVGLCPAQNQITLTV